MYFNKFLNFNKFLTYYSTVVNFYDFKCAWFDEKDYFEFFPLHVVYKLRKGSKKESPDQLKFDELYSSSGSSRQARTVSERQYSSSAVEKKG